MELLQQRKSFYKRTRKGKLYCDVHNVTSKIVRLVHEKYIRDDINCGYLCGKIVSIESFKNIVIQAPHQQVIVIDTNVALHEIDVLEHKCPATSLVIILQTVLQELRHLNLAAFRRMLNLLKDESKSYIFFPNELCVETSIQRQKNETINDSNDRAIRTATSFFDSILEDNGSIVLITNDKINQKLALADELKCMGLRQYISSFINEYPELLDLLAVEAPPQQSQKNQALFPPHLPMQEILHGIQTKKLLKGTIRSKGNGGTSCYVVVHTVEGQPRKSVTIDGIYQVNRAMDGDVVAVEIIPPDSEVNDDHFFQVHQQLIKRTQTTEGATEAGIGVETAEPSPEAIEGLEITTASSVSSENDVKTSPSGNGVPTSEVVNGSKVTDMIGSVEILHGRVVGIVKKTWRQFAGSIDSAASDLMTDSVRSGIVEGEEHIGSSALFVPVDKRIPSVLIFTRRKTELLGSRLLVTIDHWPMDSLYPMGHYVSVLGKDNDKEVETKVLLHEFGVPYEAFSADVMACLPSDSWSITEELVAQRVDLRSLPVMSIDPPGCKDIDDALHCRELPNGNYELGVHIADVTYFVHPGTALDKEAAHRSTSTYLVERRLDMLPGYLTTQLCSLRSKEDHLAFSVLWEMSPEGKILGEPSFFKSVIHSVASLTYDEAQSMLDDPDPMADDVVGNAVRALNKFAIKLRKDRIEAGALTLASTEFRFKLDAETESPTDVMAYSLKQANALVEEFMLLANITVSKKVLKHFPTLGVLRRHQPPSKEQFAPLLSAASAVGVELNISTSKTLADSLDLAHRSNDPYFNKLLRILSTRCMMPAQYFCSGELPKEQWHHYGLATPVYTHFTSPIRRYADVIVHRLLAAAVGTISLPVENADRSKQRDLCSHMNRRHKAAQHAQRASVNLHTLLFFKNRPYQEIAYVLSVNKDQITVMVPRFGIEGVISVKKESIQITNEGGGGGKSVVTDISYDPPSHSLLVTLSATGSGATGDKVYRLQVFQQVTVDIRVEESTSGGRKLLLNLVKFCGLDIIMNSEVKDMKRPATIHQASTGNTARSSSSGGGGSKMVVESQGPIQLVDSGSNASKHSGSGSGMSTDAVVASASEGEASDRMKEEVVSTEVEADVHVRDKPANSETQVIRVDNSSATAIDCKVDNREDVVKPIVIEQIEEEEEVIRAPPQDSNTDPKSITIMKVKNNEKVKSKNITTSMESSVREENDTCSNNSDDSSLKKKRRSSEGSKMNLKKAKRAPLRK